MNKVQSLSLLEVKDITHKLARKTMEWDQEIPSFETRFPGILERCLFSPFQTFDKKALYPGLPDKAAILFYLLIKNHPFTNGNKRVAVTTLLYFLYKNGKWLKVENEELYTFSLWIAQSRPEYKNEVTSAIKKFLLKNIVLNYAKLK